MPDVDYMVRFAAEEHVKVLVAIGLDVPELANRIGWRKFQSLQVWGAIKMEGGRNVLTESGIAFLARVRGGARWSVKIDGWLAGVLAARGATP